jgi:hypothetical protein
LRASADLACLADKGVRADQLGPHERDIVITWGTQMVERRPAIVNCFGGPVYR